jgi:transmembrane sensor
MSEQDYSRYILSDFLEDAFFTKWVMRPDAESDAFWNAFMENYPEKRTIIKQAAAVITTYRSQNQFNNEAHKQQVWARINATLKEQPIIKKETRVIPLYLKIAAAITLLVGSTTTFWLMQSSSDVVFTASNEIATITLPDHSIVKLNGNSTLRYEGDWDGSSPREVWLEGEAFFNVKHINKDSLNIIPGHRFIVHSNNVNIEVLGTSFNVQEQKEQTNITLITGKVKVRPAGQSAQGMIMLPGDYVEYTSNKLIARKKITNPLQAVAWTNQEFTFNNAYLRDIVKKLTEDHGYSIEVKEPDLLELKIEGEISVSSIQELLSTVSTTLDLDVKQTDKHIVISRK